MSTTIRRDNRPSHRPRAWWIVFLCMLVGGALGGLTLKMNHVDKKATCFTQQDSKSPPPIVAQKPPQFEAVHRRIGINIYLMHVLLGLAAGALTGLVFVMLGILPEIPTKDRGTAALSGWNLLRVLSCILTFAITWVASAYAAVRTLKPSNDIEFSIIIKYSAVFAVVVSWFSVGRKVHLGQRIQQVVNWLLLGPFNYLQFTRLNWRQHKALWFGCLIVVYLLLFPPWIAFEARTGSDGVGDAHFVDFHFAFSSQYKVLGTAPYAVAQVSHTMQFFFILGAVATTIFAVLSFAEKRDLERPRRSTTGSPASDQAL